MIYSQLLQKLSRFGVAQVGRLRGGGHLDTVYLGRQDEIVYPYPLNMYPLILDNGLESDIHEEVIAAILRRFEIDPAKFYPPN